MIIGWIIEGRTVTEIVPLLKEHRHLTVTHQALTAFKRRHAAEIDAAQRKVAEAVLNVTIRDKAERIHRLSGLYDKMTEIVETRGLLATDVKYVGSAEYGREVEVQRFDAALVRELRGVLSDVADELGDRPKTPLIDARTQIITLEALKEINQRAGD